jgi:two-component system, chemotaxis family, protein-glutamate methylesterase/glutaminase
MTSLKGRNIIVIGTSAGGLETLDRLIGQLPTKLSATIFIVQHTSAQASGSALVHRLSRYASFEPKLAEHGETFKRGRIYIAPPDNHLLVKKTKLLVTKGARENRSRPGIDPLFRSAAVAHGSRVIGVILSGLLDDGTAGLLAIKQCGGVSVVQDPKDAAYPAMPQNAVDNADVDFCVPLEQMGQLLTKLVAQRRGRTKTAPHDVRTEAVIAERVLSDVSQVNGLGDQVPYNCPNCGGVLWELGANGAKRYRCHTGHSFTRPALLVSQSEKIEEMLWIALRMFEERNNLLTTMLKKERGVHLRRWQTERLKETQGHIERIRAMLLGS